MDDDDDDDAAAAAGHDDAAAAAARDDDEDAAAARDDDDDIVVVQQQQQHAAEGGGGGQGRQQQQQQQQQEAHHQRPFGDGAQPPIAAGGAPVVVVVAADAARRYDTIRVRRPPMAAAAAGGGEIGGIMDPQRQRRLRQDRRNSYENYDSNYYYYLPEVVSVRISRDGRTTPEQLADCVRQALHLPYYCCPDGRDGDASSFSPSIVGMFEEETSVFVSLRQVLDDAAAAGGGPASAKVYTLFLRPPPRPRQAPQPPVDIVDALYKIALYGVVPVTAAYLVYAHASAIVRLAIDTVAVAYERFLEIPLQEFYRYGPWFAGGWEGVPLAQVCARLTLNYGDVDFWNRNLEECQHLFETKREAWMRVARPITCFAFGIAVFVVLRFLMLELLRNRGPFHPPPDRDMVETYRAFQVLLRQIKRNVAPTQQQQQQQHHHHHQPLPNIIPPRRNNERGRR